LIAAAPAGADVLYDQMSGAGPYGTNSQDYSDVGLFDNQAADDFTVPSGVSWSPTAVDVLGDSNGGSYPVTVTFYSDGGSKPGAQLFDQTIAGTQGGPNYNLPLVGGPTLPPGHFWLSVQEVSEYGPSEHQWLWLNRAPQAGDPAQWASPGSLMASCNSWVARASCAGDAGSPDQAFMLIGSSAPVSASNPPSNQVSLGQTKFNKENGTAIEPVTVPGPGELILGGSGLVTQRRARASASRTVSAAGTVALLIKAKGKTKKKLNHRGKVKVKATISFTPSGGQTASVTKAFKLRKTLRRR
jgi:hypothetical protein